MADPFLPPASDPASAPTATPASPPEQALRESEQRLQLAFEAAQIGVAEYHFATGRVIFTDNFIRLLGYEPDSVPQTFDWFLSRVHPDDQAAVRSAFETVTTGDSVEDTQYRVVRADGEVRWWAARGRVVRERGQAVRVIGLFTDVTERKHLEEQVRQSVKLEAIGQLAGGIAHDFNNLLTVITGYAETLLAALDAADPKVADVVEIRRAADRAAMLTQQLLAFSRKQVLRPEHVDANEIIRDISTMIGRLISGSIDLKVAVAATPMTVLADRGQMEQVLLNLAVNARDAMPGGGTLEIATQLVDVSERKAHQLYPIRPGRYVLISVRDTGVGMTPDVRARVFEPFFTTKAAGAGTGIGLATVYGIVKQSGGFIFADSAPGEGTTFDVYLPFTPASADELEEVGRDLPREACTILLVDDYRRVRELARKVLTRQGYRVIAASSGDEAIEMAEKYPGAIDLLVSDVVMSGLSGPELARELQARRPGLSVLYMSGYAGAALGVAGHDASFIQKPFTPAALAQKVRDVLNRRGARATIRLNGE